MRVPLFAMQVSGRFIRLRRPDPFGQSGRAPCDRALRNKERALAFRNDLVGAVEGEKTTIHPHSISDRTEDTLPTMLRWIR